MWIIFSEKKNQQISSTVIEEEKFSCIYKNYIYKGKNWKCPVCNANDGHCEYYYCILYKRIHPKDRAYKMRSDQQCKCLEPNGNSSREGEDAY